MSGVTDERIVELYAEAEIAVVPSLYEGFSLPADRGDGVRRAARHHHRRRAARGRRPARRERDARARRPTPARSRTQIVEVLNDAELRARLGEGGRRRVLDRFTWRKTAEGTAEHYYLELEAHAQPAPRRRDRD